MLRIRCGGQRQVVFGENMRLITVLSLLATFFIAGGCSSAKNNDLDALLLKAKNEKKAVMLELGSVGCVPCDMMQPVIVRLSDQYRGRMEVYFVDVKMSPAWRGNSGFTASRLRCFSMQTARSSTGMSASMSTMK
ncbi:MAG TPA: thioredoxin family protein [Dissulfurispiraceae bacterium]|nr:thioredoxin family protein [Dissulfurispiraceae bacterium]